MRRDRSHYGAGFEAELLFIGGLLLLVFGPAAQAQTVAGSFQSVAGQVQIQRSGGATIGAAAGVGVNVGDRIVTGPNGHAVIILNDQSRLELGPSSSITLDQFTVAGGAGSTRVSLFSGVLRSLVNSASGAARTDYQVHTPNAVAAVRGTKFDIAFTENTIRPGYQGCEQYTDVSVYQGTVNLALAATPNGSVDISAGYESTLPCDHPPITPGPLAMTGAVSLDSANAGGGNIAALAPASGGAPVPACPVCVPMTTTTVTTPPHPPPPNVGVVH